MGGTGRIGRFVLQQLEGAGYEYKVLCRKMTPDIDETKFIKGDITDYSVVESATKGVDAIVLLAAYAWDYPAVYSNPPGYAQMWNVNLTGPFNVLEASVKNNVSKLVYASSACAVGFMTWGNSHEIEYFPVDEKHPCRPYSLYGAGKLMIEQLCFMYTKKFGIKTICLRIGTAWYPPKYHEEMTTMFRENMIKMTNREPLDGSQRDQAWYYVGVEDVAQAFLLALKNDKIEYGIYNIGADESGSGLDSLEIVRLYFPGVQVRNPELFLAEKKKPLYDITKAQRELGYRPKFHWKDWGRENES
jgi:nucleoside-diphosphate-sugar epimerase